MNNKRPVPRWALQHCCEQVSIWKIDPKLPYLQTIPKVEESEFKLKACEEVIIMNAGRLLVEGKIAIGPAQVHTCMRRSELESAVQPKRKKGKKLHLPGYPLAVEEGNDNEDRS